MQDQNPSSIPASPAAAAVTSNAVQTASATVNPADSTATLFNVLHSLQQTHCPPTVLRQAADALSVHASALRNPALVIPLLRALLLALPRGHSQPSADLLRAVAAAICHLCARIRYIDAGENEPKAAIGTSAAAASSVLSARPVAAAPNSAPRSCSHSKPTRSTKAAATATTLVPTAAAAVVVVQPVDIVPSSSASASRPSSFYFADEDALGHMLSFLPTPDWLSAISCCKQMHALRMRSLSWPRVVHWPLPLVRRLIVVLHALLCCADEVSVSTACLSFAQLLAPVAPLPVLPATNAVDGHAAPCDDDATMASPTLVSLVLARPGLLLRFVTLLQPSPSHIQIAAALRVCGHLAGASNGAAHALVESGIWAPNILEPLLQSTVPVQLRRDCCWLLANLFVAPHALLPRAILHKWSRVLVRILLRRRDEAWSVRREAAVALANATLLLLTLAQTQPQQAGRFDAPTVSVLGTFLEADESQEQYKLQTTGSADSHVTMYLLRVLQALLRQASKVTWTGAAAVVAGVAQVAAPPFRGNAVASLLDQCRGRIGIQAIRELHADPSVRDLAALILQAYF
jgi:hypothetical protein